jgi:FkbM family methyltransferase
MKVLMFNSSIRKITKILINSFIRLIPAKAELKKHIKILLIQKYRNYKYVKFINKLNMPNQNIMLVGNYKIKYPNAHTYKETLSKEPLREYYLGVLAKYIFCTDYLEYIDLGANIGDSYAIVKTHATNDFKAILVEPSPFFQPYLKANVKIIGTNALVIEKFAGLNFPLANLNAELHHWGGTAELRRSKNIIGIHDQIFVGELINESTALIKIDCDGSDLYILNSLSQDLAENKPIIFFEAVVDNSEAYELFCRAVTSLEKLGYSYATILHCSGLLMYSGPIDEHFFDIIRLQLNLYLSKAGGNFYYVDVAVFSEIDKDVYLRSLLDLREKNIELFRL